MKVQKRRNTRLAQIDFKLDHDEFYALTDLLFEILKEKHSLCARVLGVSTSTWRRWETNPPTMPHWNLVLRHVIKTLLRNLVATKKSTTKKHKRRMTEALALIPHSTDFEEDVAYAAYDDSEATLHLRHLLQGEGMYWDEIRTAGNSGGFSQKTLRTAAARLNVVKTQQGYGDHKRSFWRLPGPDD